MMIPEPNPSAFNDMDVYELAQLLSETKHALEAVSKDFEEIYPHISALKKVINHFDEIDAQLSAAKKKMDKEYRYVLDALIDVEDYSEIEFDDVEDKEDLPCFVYYILNEEKDKVKIGISNDPMMRAKNLQTASGEEIELLHTIKFKNREEALSAESCLHKQFSVYRKRPSKVAKSCEWFDATIVDTLMHDYTSREAVVNLETQQRLGFVESVLKYHSAM